jgi:effector-binding domain-containing protein
MSANGITRRELDVQPILFIRRRLGRHELQPMFAECFGKIYMHCQKTKAKIGGMPLARYVSLSPGLWVVEAAMPLAEPAPGDGEIEPGFLAGGPVAVGVHAGAYDRLHETYVAVQRWVEDKGLCLRTGSAPWEQYVTDPSTKPDPADWRTEVYWPLEK